MLLLSQVEDAAVWDEYFRYKQEKGHLSRSDEKDLCDYLSKKEYLTVTEAIRNGGAFPLPEKKMIRKMGSSKKRTVYIYPREWNYVLKLLTFLLLRQYDGIFSDALYSFRVNNGVKNAVRRIRFLEGREQKYVYKVDISNYFNSIPVDAVCEILKEVMAEEEEAEKLLEALLKDKRVIDKGQVIEEEKGVMAGVPTAVFLANLYLKDLDRQCDVLPFFYARYSDDILILADDEKTCYEGSEFIRKELEKRGLSVNPEKEAYSRPGEKWAFLGIGFSGNVIDISDVSVEKLKAKMRRRARALKRWQARKKATNEQTAKAFIRAMNRKFFSPDSSQELTWSRWYFPVINSDRQLHALDEYMQYWVRYLATGKHNQAAYRFTYEDMKRLGYVSLVHFWWEERRASTIEKTESSIVP